ncbi:hypothetical protein [Ramlibacter humi]|uniref:hypothetical protein n=1 Tax=Ramlibacter humi TaxID=2530451 RepID=UPI0014320F53|nr:hypothetical protein [Ramlibacter humi]
MLETIERYRHLFLATYTVQADGAWHGYTKICPVRPLSVWETSHAFRKTTSGGCESQPQAHEISRRTARDFIDRVFDDVPEGVDADAADSVPMMLEAEGVVRGQGASPA